jgi:PrgI family protein
VRLPADVELEDRLAFGLTGRQLLLLALTALPAYGVFSLASSALPLPVAAAIVAPLALIGGVLVLGRRDGLSGDRYALAVLRHLTGVRRRVLAPEGLAAPARRELAPLDLPVRSILRSGVVELADGSFCVVLRAASAAFALRSDEEQEALVAGFARFLNGLIEPAQIVVRSEPVDLASDSRDILASAADIANPALRAAATGYADFLTGLGADTSVRRREILLVLTTRAARSAAETLERRAQEATELLRQAGVELRLLDGEQVAQLLASALDPPGPPAGSLLDGVIHRC